MAGIITVPLHIGDFLSGTMHMDTLEKGAYMMLMLAHYQAGEKGIPADDKKLANIAGVTLKKWQLIKPVLAEKFETVDGSWRSKKCIEVLQKVFDHSSSQRAKALKRHKPSHATAEPQQCQPKPKPKPIEEKDRGAQNAPPPKPRQKNGTRIPDDWECDVDLGKWAMSQGLTRDKVLHEIEQFTDHWRTATGKGSTALDWDLKFKTWIRNSVKWQK